MRVRRSARRSGASAGESGRAPAAAAGGACRPDSARQTRRVRSNWCRCCCAMPSQASRCAGSRPGATGARWPRNAAAPHELHAPSSSIQTRARCAPVGPTCRHSCRRRGMSVRHGRRVHVDMSPSCRSPRRTACRRRRRRCPRTDDICAQQTVERVGAGTRSSKAQAVQVGGTEVAEHRCAAAHGASRAVVVAATIAAAAGFASCFAATWPPPARHSRRTPGRGAQQSHVRSVRPAPRTRCSFTCMRHHPPDPPPTDAAVLRRRGHRWAVAGRCGRHAGCSPYGVSRPSVPQSG